MTPLATDKTTQVRTILERSVCLVLKCSYLGNARNVNLKDIKMSKEVDGADVDLGSAKRQMSATKMLVDSRELSACNKTIYAAQAYLRSISIAGYRVFGPGTYLVPTKFVGEAEERLAQFQADLEKHVRALAARWDLVVAKQKETLGPVFDPKEYASADEVRNAFEIDWSYASFAAPDKLEEVHKAAYERADKKYRAQLAAAHDEVVSQLREAALRVMQELVNRLKPSASGGAKALHPTALRDLNDLLQRLPVLNMSDDDSLVNILAPVGAVAEGVEVETLRKAPAIRGMLLEKAEQAIEKLDSLVTSGRRAMSFGAV